MENEEYFRKCWLTLKARYPRLRKRMDEIEVSLVGLLPPRTPPKKDDKEPEKLGEVV